jgi:hypothetical protein
MAMADEGRAGCGETLRRADGCVFLARERRPPPYVRSALASSITVPQPELFAREPRRVTEEDARVRMHVLTGECFDRSSEGERETVKDCARRE